MNYTNIVLVEDEPAIRRMLTMMMTRSGYEVDAFGAAEPAYEHIENNLQDFILITDQELPRMYGSQLAEKVKTLNESTPIIIMTGYIDPSLEIEADVILEKPIARIETLISALTAAADHAEKRMQPSP